MIEMVQGHGEGVHADYFLYADGRRLEGVVVEFQGGNAGDGGVYTLSTQNLESFKILTSYAFKEFPAYKGGSGYKFPLATIIFVPPLGEIGLIDRIAINKGSIECISEPELNVWNRPYSFLDYCDEFSKLAKTEYGISTSFDQYSSDFAESLTMQFLSRSADEPIEQYLSPALEIIRKVHQDTEKILTLKIDEKSVIASFPDFPKEVRAYCEQYLMYFVQFLQDLGVDASSDIKHEAGQVLFTVTPKNEHEALDKIRTALEIYLYLPSSPIKNEPTSEIAIQRLESQVLRFQSDLKLATAELQAKNATIEAQQLIINVQKALLQGEIFAPPMKDIGPARKEEGGEDREEFLGGMVALTTYKDKGVEVSWAKLFRHLRDWFKDKGESEKPSG